MTNKNPYKILVVDQDPMALASLRNDLERVGYQVLSTQEGKQVMDSLDKDKPDLLLLDVMIPDMSGFDLIKKIKNDSRYKRIPIIVIAADTGTDAKVQGLSLGAEDYVTEPFDFEEVNARILSQLRLKDMEKKLVYAEKLKALSEMAGAAVHELAQPLTYAMVKIEMFLRKSEKSGEWTIGSADLQQIYNSLEKISEVMSQIQGIRSFRDQK